MQMAERLERTKRSEQFVPRQNERRSKRVSQAKGMRMAFCGKCGARIQDGADYCPQCGAAVSAASIDESAPGRNQYDGTIHKCPRCGEAIASFELICPSCGLELRDVSAAKSLEALDGKLKDVSSDKERANVIRSFPIPNTREDILELMILASSNMGGLQEGEELSAWKTKYEQCYQKARLAFGDSAAFDEVGKAREAASHRMRQEEIDRGVRMSIGTMMHPLVLLATAGILIHEIIWLANGNGFGLINVIFDALVLWAAIRASKRLMKIK